MLASRHVCKHVCWLTVLTAIWQASRMACCLAGLTTGCLAVLTASLLVGLQVSKHVSRMAGWMECLQTCANSDIRLINDNRRRELQGRGG